MFQPLISVKTRNPTTFLPQLREGTPFFPFLHSLLYSWGLSEAFLPSVCILNFHLFWQGLRIFSPLIELGKGLCYTSKKCTAQLAAQKKQERLNMSSKAKILQWLGDYKLQQLPWPALQASELPRISVVLFTSSLTQTHPKPQFCPTLCGGVTIYRLTDLQAVFQNTQRYIQLERGFSRLLLYYLILYSE